MRPPHPDVPTALSRLTAEFSIEVTPREARKIRRFRDHLRSGTSVYVTFLANTPFAETVEVVRRLAAEGMRPVPHLAARAFRNRLHLDEQLAVLTDAGVEEVLLIAGSLREPVGQFDASIQVLRTGCLEHRGIRRVGVAGHPEGNPSVSEEDLRQAIKEKNEFAAESSMQLYLLTQFCFASHPVVAWERQIRAEGNELPVHVGLPGLASPATLVKFGLSCGVGPSLTVLRKQAGSIVKLATAATYHPDQTMTGVAAAAVEDSETRLQRFHFFPFGAFAGTARWAQAVAHGQFGLDEAGEHIEVHR